MYDQPLQATAVRNMTAIAAAYTNRMFSHEIIAVFRQNGDKINAQPVEDFF